MTSLKQKVFGFIRQLSAPSVPEDRSAENFIQNYLKGFVPGLFFYVYYRSDILLSISYSKEIHRNEPDILHGRSPQELPRRSIGNLYHNVLCAMTGPDGGLTTVNKQEKHLSTSDPDIHFIDDQTGENDCLLCSKLYFACRLFVILEE